MNELVQTLQAFGAQSIADEVFDGLDVVLRRGFIRRNGVDIGRGKASDYVAQSCDGRGGQRCSSSNALGTQADEPFDLDPDPGSVERCLREELGQRCGGFAVAPIERAQWLVAQL